MPIEKMRRKEPGGNFTDITLRIRVLGAADTVVAFRPSHLHGTTLADPSLQRQGIIFSFSNHIKKAYLKSLEVAEQGRLIAKEHVYHH